MVSRACETPKAIRLWSGLGARVGTFGATLCLATVLMVVSTDDMIGGNSSLRRWFSK